MYIYKDKNHWRNESITIEINPWQQNSNKRERERQTDRQTDREWQRDRQKRSISIFNHGDGGIYNIKLLANIIEKYIY